MKLPAMYKLPLLLSNARVLHGPLNTSPDVDAGIIFDHLFVFKFHEAKKYALWSIASSLTIVKLPPTYTT